MMTEPNTDLSLKDERDEFSLGFTGGAKSTKCLHFATAVV